MKQINFSLFPDFVYCPHIHNPKTQLKKAKTTPLRGSMMDLGDSCTTRVCRSPRRTPHGVVRGTCMEREDSSGDSHGTGL